MDLIQIPTFYITLQSKRVSEREEEREREGRKGRKEEDVVEGGKRMEG